MNKIDRFILSRLSAITLFILLILIGLFLIIDFSENSDDFTDRGAKFSMVFGDYYLNYIPEMIRLVTPVAAFIACLLFTGQLSDRFEIIALKSSGVSLFRIYRSYFIFSAALFALLFYLDGWVIPPSNLKRHGFERVYLAGKITPANNRDLYRQLDSTSMMRLQFINEKGTNAFNAELFDFSEADLQHHTTADKLIWSDSTLKWQIETGWAYLFDSTGYKKERLVMRDTSLPVYPRDLARTSSDIYELTYPQIVDYLDALNRSGSSGDSLPRVQFYSKLAYPLTLIIGMLIGLPLASFRSKRGKGVHLAMGLAISFIYLTAMKITEPFGAASAVPEWTAALAPHVFFLFVGLILFWRFRQ